MDKEFKRMSVWEKISFIVNQPSAKERISFFKRLDEEFGYDEKIEFFTRMQETGKTTYFNQMTAEEREVYLRGLSNIPRDYLHCEDRYLNRFIIFLSGLADYLKNPCPKKITLKELEELAEKAIPDHYCGLGERCYSEKEKEFIQEFLQKLLNKDGEAWGRILQPLSKSGSFEGIYSQMLDLSPLKGKIVLFISYSCGKISAILSPQLDQLIERIKKERGLEINYSYGDYLLSLPIQKSDLLEKSKEMIFADIR